MNINPETGDEGSVTLSMSQLVSYEEKGFITI